MRKVDLSDLGKKWPSSVVARGEIRRFSGGLMSPGRMANIDCLGQGPERFRVGKKICYRVEALIEWLENRSQAV